MSTAPLIHAIQERLRRAGYRGIATPFQLAGVEFAFTAAMRGRDGRGLDLVLLFDTTTGDHGDRDGSRIRQRVEALSRALDVTGSRYVVTAIFAGALLTAGVEALADTCRVLQVDAFALDEQGRPADAAAARQLDDQILVLLPLDMPDPANEALAGSAPAMEQLAQALPAGIGKAMIEALVTASSRGEEAVTAAAGRAVAVPFGTQKGAAA